MFSVPGEFSAWFVASKCFALLLRNTIGVVDMDEERIVNRNKRRRELYAEKKKNKKNNECEPGIHESSSARRNKRRRQLYAEKKKTRHLLPLKTLIMT